MKKKPKSFLREREEVESQKKTKSFGGKLFTIALLKGLRKNIEKKLSLLAGKISLEKKAALLNVCLVTSQKYTKSFGGKNLASCKKVWPVKSHSFIVDFWSDPVQKGRIFFFFATLHSQKIVKERAYIPTSFQALLKAHFFCLCMRSTKDNKQRILLKFLFSYCTIN